MSIPGKQRVSIQHIATIQEGIQNLDEDKVRTGLGSLYNALKLEHERDMPLSPFFDLVTTMRKGREDFLSLEIKNLLALLIHDMAQEVYQANQSGQLIGITDGTRKDLINGLTHLLDLLNARKEPCVTAITCVEIAKTLVATLSTSKDNAESRFSDLVSVIRPFAGKFGSFVGDASADLVSLSFKGVKLIYEIGAEFYEMRKSSVAEANGQAFVLQLALVRSWKVIVLADQQETALNSELAPLKKYFEHIQNGEIKPLIRRLFRRVGKRAAEVFSSDVKGINDTARAIKQFRRGIAGKMVGMIGNIEAIKEADTNTKQLKLIPLLREVAFYALLDLYSVTDNPYIKCEILSLFGEIATRPIESNSLNPDSLKWLITTRGYSKPDPGSELSTHIETRALMALLWAIWPLEPKTQESDLMISAMTPEEAVPQDNATPPQEDKKALLKDKEWALRCTAIEALLRFDHFYREKEKKEPKEHTPIANFLEQAGQEYRLMSLLVNRLKLSGEQIDELRGFIGLARKQAKTMTSQTDSELKNKKETIEVWLKSKLELDNTECDHLLSFLKESKEKHNEQGNGENEQTPYSGLAVRPVLDKLIDKFDLTESERKLIDEAIFQGHGENAVQTSWEEKLTKAFKNFFTVNHYPKIACAFNNLGKIKAMIEEEEKTKGRFTA
jgi:hypothetical protein